MIPTLDTDRLTLRAPQQRDFKAYEAFFADGAASTFYGGPLRSDGAWRRLAADVGHWHLRGYGIWALEQRGSRETVGGCGLWWPSGWPRSELTWWLLPSARGHGLATEASRAAISYAYDVLTWNVVQTHMDDRNDAARRLVVRLGGNIIAREVFPDGRERDVFAIPDPSRAPSHR